MRAIAMAALVSLSACHLLFELGELPPDDGVLPDGDDVRPLACRHAGLQLCLTFDDEDNLGIDHSGRGLNAMMMGVAAVDRTFPPPATNEKALDVTAAAVIAIEGNNLFDLPGPMSIDLWVQHQEHPTDAQFVIDNSGQYGIKIRPIDGGGDVIIDCFFGIDPNGRFNQAFGRAAAGRWNHYACVAIPGVNGQQGEAIVYLNGDPQIQTMTFLAGETIHTGQNQFLRLAFPAIVPTPDPTTMIPPTSPFVGQLDNVRIWNRALDRETEIKLFAQGDETGN